jgi:hypothetical protein
MVKIAAIVMYTIGLIFVLLMVGFSGGAVLNVSKALGTSSPLGTAAISLFCWAILLVLPILLILSVFRSRLRKN